MCNDDTLISFWILPCVHTNPTETQTIHSLIIDCHVSVNLRTINVALIAAEVAQELQQLGLTAEYTLSADCHFSVKRRTINH